MKRQLLPAAIVLFGLVVGACQGAKPTMTDPSTGKRLVCRECYDAVTEAHRAHPVSNATGVQILRTSQCPCCKTEMSVYIQDGTPMVKCGGCAAEGVAWDRCLPSDSSQHQGR